MHMLLFVDLTYRLNEFTFPGEVISFGSVSQKKKKGFKKTRFEVGKKQIVVTLIII